MKLSLEQVRHVAALARLALTPEEERRYQTQLSAILDAMERLRALDTSNVEATAAGGAVGEEMLQAVRADEPVPSLPPERALANAPARHGTAFAVPKVIE
ncbi:MAG TPA: Asp-tRNA(Asn)/Glu-tRNA(Gln) amidotransferase subunit GatC [Myxococcaceae bacterium]|nr:Asp-tRNA(Asn)/Glu-tRNA(Gln) amidotransferase subunit GatC [Myxococcaceae bacterium]